MALRKFYIGSHGPFYVDDADLVNDPDGDFAAETMHALLTDGPMKVESVPTDGDHVVRLSDVGGIVHVKTESRLSGVESGLTSLMLDIKRNDANDIIRQRVFR